MDGSRKIIRSMKMYGASRRWTAAPKGIDGGGERGGVKGGREKYFASRSINQDSQYNRLKFCMMMSMQGQACMHLKKSG